METATYVALSRQTVVSQAMDVLANNLANASTTAFKGEKSVFREFLATGPDNQQISYVRAVDTVRDTKHGDLSPTGNALDTGIDGDGYYSIQTGQGVQYTRNGRFELSAQNQLVTEAGDPVLDDRGNPITVPAGKGAITILENGSISVGGNAAGKIGLVSFADQQQMKQTGAGLYSTNQAPTPDTVSQVHQGVLEKSNVQPVVEMTKLMGMERSYTNIQEILDSEDTRLKSAIDKLSRVA